jgi:hypothetical protein
MRTSPDPPWYWKLWLRLWSPLADWWYEEPTGGWPWDETEDEW